MFDVSDDFIRQISTGLCLSGDLDPVHCSRRQWSLAIARVDDSVVDLFNRSRIEYGTPKTISKIERRSNLCVFHFPDRIFWSDFRLFAYLVNGGNARSTVPVQTVVQWRLVNG